MPMNIRISRLFFILVILFAVLIGFTSYWSVIDAEGLKDNVANKRPLLEQQRVRRGLIYAGDGIVLARNIARGRGSDKFYRRTYPTAGLFAHPVGYSFVERGRTGLERYYEDDLAGQKGEFGTLLDQIRGADQEGDDLLTSLDPQTQRVAVNGLAGRAGSVVAMDPQTGRVLAMVSVPSYDPNDVLNRFDDLRNAPGSPILNRATQAGYPPGSTFKVVTATAAIDSGRYTPLSVVSGKSPKIIDGVPLSNFGGEQFGSITLTEALTHSVNTVWAEVGVKLGKKTVFKYMDRYGFNRKPPVDLPSSEKRASGVYDNGELLDDSDAIDLGRVAIGQERLQVTPLQMAMVASAVANGGILMRPRIATKVRDADGRTVRSFGPSEENRVMKKSTAAQLAAMMSRVVAEGTGTAAALQGIDVAGKTGTAEKGQANQAWFIGFAPVRNPRVAVAVTIEQTAGQGGTVAAPIAKSVMESVLR